MSNGRITARQLSGNLNFSTAQKMIHRLLTNDRIKTELDEGRVRSLGSCDDKPVIKTGAFTKKELAQKLSITLEELKKLGLPYFYRRMAVKISVPLVSLYCSTKFADGEYKGG